MAASLQTTQPLYTAGRRVLLGRNGYGVAMFVYCKKQGNLFFRRATPVRSAIWRLTLTAGPVILPGSIEIHGIPFEHRQTFLSLAEQNSALTRALRFLLHEGGFNIKLVDEVLEAEAGSRCMEKPDPDDASQALEDLARAIDALSFEPPKSTWPHLAVGLAMASFVSGIIAFAMLPSAPDERIWLSPQYNSIEHLFIGGILLVHYFLFAFFLRRHPLSNYVVPIIGAGWFIPALILGSQLATMLDDYGPKKEMTAVIKNGHIVITRITNKNGSNTPYFHLNTSSPTGEPLDLFGTDIPSFPLSAGEYYSLSSHETLMEGDFSIEVSQGRLGTIKRGGIRRLQ